MTNANGPSRYAGVFTTGELARLAGVGISSVIRQFDLGELVGYRLPRSYTHRRVTYAAAREWLRKWGLDEATPEAAAFCREES